MGYLLCTVLLMFMVAHSDLVAGMNFPPIATVLNNYPLTPRATFLQDAKLPSSLTGPTDALRVSYALIKSGYTFEIQQNEYGWSGTVNTDDEKYIKKVGTMRQYLTAEVGDPFNSQNENQYQGKKGVIVFRNCVNVQPHVDLYDGNTCKKQCSFQDCNTHDLFELP